MKLICLLAFTFWATIVFAADVDTITTRSAAMNKDIKAVVITPDNYGKGQSFPVVYLLHGYSGNYADWVLKAPQARRNADLHQVIIVCPDGGFGSWYFDSPVDAAYRYETYVATELVQQVDSRYKTIKDRKGRAITGLSMGGHGALYLAMRHPDVYGAAGSMSGGVDIRPFPNNWDLAARLGKYSQQPEAWEKNTVVNMLHLLTPGLLSLIVDCGTEDFFYNVNVQLHQKLRERNIPHDFVSRPGAHNWTYWANAVDYQFLFFRRFFETKA